MCRRRCVSPRFRSGMLVVLPEPGMLPAVIGTTDQTDWRFFKAWPADYQG
jgi:hypothetical protein